MKRAIKEVFWLGLGAARITRKQTERVIKKFVQASAISKKDANELITTVLKEGKKMQETLKREGKKEVRSIRRKIVSTGRRVERDLSKGIKRMSGRK